MQGYLYVCKLACGVNWLRCSLVISLMWSSGHSASQGSRAILYPPRHRHQQSGVWIQAVRYTVYISVLICEAVIRELDLCDAIVGANGYHIYNQSSSFCIGAWSSSHTQFGELYRLWSGSLLPLSYRMDLSNLYGCLFGLSVQRALGIIHLLYPGLANNKDVTWHTHDLCQKNKYEKGIN